MPRFVELSIAGSRSSKHNFPIAPQPAGNDARDNLKSRVKGKLTQGETVVTGNADCVNITGSSVREARELVQSSMPKESDPLENQKFPKAQREHAQQYFESLRKND